MTLHLISASAGTGKTEKLSRVVADALDARAEHRIDVEGLIAVTYTHKAEAELKSRIRQTLIKRGAFDEAQRLPLAYVGTVHAICNRLLTEFALSAGLSPGVDVLPESASERAIAEALEAALDNDHLVELDVLCRRLRPNWDSTAKEYNWTADAEDLIELARSNRIAIADLAKMAERSIAGFAPMMGRSRSNGNEIEDGLRKQIERALKHLLGSGDEQKNTGAAIVKLRDASRLLAMPETMPWSFWMQLSELSAASAHEDVMVHVQAAAARHREHPRFHEDTSRYTRLLYEAVAKGLTGYTTWKAERRYIDYVDMEERALELLDRKEVAHDLRGRLQLLLVDEFQDTSPIQLALFLQIEKLCQRSIWVGDRKQSIFAFRGADPALMDAVIAAAKKAGDETEVLSTSYRSRKRLVDFTSELFARSFAVQGYDEKQVRIDAKRDAEDPRLAALPPLGLWWFESSNQEDDAAGIAEGIWRMLSTPSETPVLDRANGQVRDVRASDIAVLVATNTDASAIAKALGARGIRAAVPRKRLLETPEGTLLHAGLRVAVDERDTIARSHVEALCGFDGKDPDAWLTQLIEAKTAKAWPAPFFGDAESMIQLSPTEAVDQLIGRLDLTGRCARWPRPDERVANLEAFRALAADYENECEAQRSAGSLVGFLHFLDGATETSAFGSDKNRRDDQHAGGDNAVEICTYHRAKGLEWPVVILASLASKTRAFGVPPDAAAMRLQRGGRSQLFSAYPESDQDRFDAGAPLAGRWLRFWPWPYGGIQTSELVDRVALTNESQRVIRSAANESLRLLYVGFTRARDHLILAGRAKKKETKPAKPKRGEKPVVSAPTFTVTLALDWLDTINDGKVPLLELPTGNDAVQPVTICGSVAKADARVWWLRTSATEKLTKTESPLRRWYKAEPLAARTGYGIAPSKAAEHWPDAVSRAANVSIKLHTIGPRIAFASGGNEMSDVGTAVHAFFAADPMTRDLAQRRAVAEHILTMRGFSSVARPNDLVVAHDRLREFLAKLYPDAAWHREVPVAGKIGSPEGARQVSGSIDLLLKTNAGWAVVDHKTYPGVDLESKACTNAPQLAAYETLLQADSASTKVDRFVHFPIAGVIAELNF